MKIGVSSYSFSKYMRDSHCNYFDICDKAKEYGFDAIEFIDLDLKVQPAKNTIELAKEIRAYCDKIGLSIAAYTVGANFLENKNEVKRIKGKVDEAEALGVPVMRHDGCWRLTEDTPDWQAAVKKIAPMIRKVTEYAAAKGIKTCTENHGTLLQDAERVETLIRTVDNPNYGWLCDIGNFLCADDNPLRAVAIAAPYAFHAHVKDFLVKPADADDPGEGWFKSRGGNYLRGTVAGHGVVPVKKCIALLKAAGYDGTVSCEFEGMEDNLTALQCAGKFIRKCVEEV